MLHQYFGLSTSEVSARRQLLGIEEKMDGKPQQVMRNLPIFGKFGKDTNNEWKA